VGLQFVQLTQHVLQGRLVLLLMTQLVILVVHMIETILVDLIQHDLTHLVMTDQCMETEILVTENKLTQEVVQATILELQLTQAVVQVMRGVVQEGLPGLLTMRVTVDGLWVIEELLMTEVLVMTEEVMEGELQHMIEDMMKEGMGELPLVEETLVVGMPTALLEGMQAEGVKALAVEGVGVVILGGIELQLAED